MLILTSKFIYLDCPISKIRIMRLSRREAGQLLFGAFSHTPIFSHDKINPPLISKIYPLPQNCNRTYASMETKASETCRVLLQLLTNILPSCITLVLYIYQEYSNINFHRNPPCGRRVFHVDRRIDRQTDRQTDMTKLIVAFRNFANT